MSSRPESVRLALSARVNFTHHVDEGYLFEALTRAYPNHRIYRAAFAHTAAVTGAVDAMVDMHNRVWDQAPRLRPSVRPRSCSSWRACSPWRGPDPNRSSGR